MKQILTYKPEMDALSESEQELLNEDLKLIEEVVQRSAKVNRTSHSTRNAHAKSFGFLRGSFIPVSNEAADFSKLLKGSNLGVIIRYSHPSSFVSKGAWEYPVYGCSVKIFNKNVAASAKFPLVNFPVFITNSVSKFLNIHIKANVLFKALAKNKIAAAFKVPALMRAGFSIFFDLQLPAILRNFVKFFDIERQFLPTYDFHSIGCFRVGNRVAKIRLQPNFTPEIPKGNDIDQAKMLEEYFSKNELSLDFQLQLATSERRTPVNNLLKNWSEKNSKFITVGKIILPQQAISTYDKPDYENLSFNPFENIAQLQPVGRMQQVRKKIYEVSVATRQALNQK